jgi:hypothetical protein
MPSKRWITAAAPLILTAGQLSIGAAQADETTTCHATIDFDLTPGFSAQPSTGAFTTHGETAPIECAGPVNGHRPTGPGMVGGEGRYGVPNPASCASAVTGDGAGVRTETATIPTADGPVHLVNKGTFTFGGKVPTHGGLVAGSFSGQGWSGTFEFLPLTGDCFTSPVTRVRVFAEFHLPGPTPPGRP